MNPDIPAVRALQRVAVLTSGGDAPGMNAAVRAVTRSACVRGIEVVGIERGFSGLLEGRMRTLGLASVGGVLQRGGTMLKTDRCSAFLEPAARIEAARRLRQASIDALIVIGGNGSLTGAHRLAQESGLAVVGLPGTIDNDIAGSESSIGFDTAVNTGLEAIDRIRDTAHAHERLFLVEVMGRSSGFLAMAVGIAGGAEAILLPGQAADAEAVLAELSPRPKASSLIVVAEGENPGSTQDLAACLSELGHPARACILGHIQRGGSPSGRDRVLASMLGASAVDHLLGGCSDVMVGVEADRIVSVALATVTTSERELLPQWRQLARTLAS